VSCPFLSCPVVSAFVSPHHSATADDLLEKLIVTYVVKLSVFYGTEVHYHVHSNLSLTLCWSWWRGETVSLNCGHQQAYCLSPNYIEPRWNDTDRRKPKNLFQCHFNHHKSHMDWHRCEPGPPPWKADDWLPEPWIGHNWTLYCARWIQPISSNSVCLSPASILCSHTRANPPRLLLSCTLTKPCVCFQCFYRRSQK
jgi:hypothetical protein